MALKPHAPPKQERCAFLVVSNALAGQKFRWIKTSGLCLGVAFFCTSEKTRPSENIQFSSPHLVDERLAPAQLIGSLAPLFTFGLQMFCESPPILEFTKMTQRVELGR